MSRAGGSNPDDLVERWHTTPDEKRPLTVFLADRLGWSLADVKKWIETGNKPGAEGTGGDRDGV